MIVASFLVKDLIIPTGAGRAGPFHWSAWWTRSGPNKRRLAVERSSGMDPKPLLIFNPYTRRLASNAEAPNIRRLACRSWPAWPPPDLLSGTIAPSNGSVTRRRSWGTGQQQGPFQAALRVFALAGLR